MLHEISVLLTTSIGDLIAKFNQADARIDAFENREDKDVEIKIDDDEAQKKIKKIKEDIDTLERSITDKQMELRIDTMRSEQQAKNLKAQIDTLTKEITDKKARLDVDTTAGGRNVTKLQQQIETLERRLEGKQTELKIHTETSKYRVEQLGNDVGRLEQKVKDKKLELQVYTNKFKDGITNAGNWMTGLFTKFKGIFAAITAIAGTVITFKWFVDLNDQMEQYEIQLRVMMKSAEAAQRALAEMKKFADETPYNTGEVIAAGKQLYASGLSDYQKYLGIAGDWAAAQGAKIEETVSVLARANAGQYGEAIERAREMGITMKDLWAQGLQFDKGGQFLGTAEQLMTAFEKIIKGRFGGTMRELSQSWSGLWSTFFSGIEDGARDISEGAFGMLKKGLETMNTKFQDLKNAGVFKAIGSEVGGLLTDLGRIVEPIVEFLVTGEGARKVWKSVGEFFSGLWSVLREVINVVAELAHLIFGIGTDVDSMGKAQGFHILAQGARYLAVAITWVAEVIARAALAVQFFHDLAKYGFEEAAKRMKENYDKVNKEYEARRNSILGVKDATKDLNNAQNKEAADAQKAQDELTKKAYDQIQAIKQKISLEQKALDAEQSVDKAYQKNAVEIAQRAFDSAQKWLEQMEKAEAMAKQIQGNEYKPSQEYLDAKVKYAETMSALHKAQIDQADSLGQYVKASEKLMAEVKAIDELGGDSTVKRYEAMKAAITEYLEELDKLRKTESDVWSSGERMAAAYKAATEGSMESMVQAYSEIEDQEKIVNVRRLEERWNVLNQLLRSEKLGAQQRKEIYDQERQVFVEYRNSMSSAIQDAMIKIDSLQKKVLSAASQAVDTIQKYFSGWGQTDALREVANSAAQVWNSTSVHTREQIEQMLALKDKLKDAGIRLDVSGISLSDYMAAFRRDVAGIPEQIKQLQDNMMQLAADMGDLGKTAAQNFFEPWTGWIDNIRSMLGNLSISPMELKMPNVTPIPSGGTATAGQIIRQITNQIKIEVDIHGIQDNMDILTNQVAGRIATKLEPILDGADYGY